MLLSHHHRFIFIRPRKTASSSVELGLARLLEPGDYATRLGTSQASSSKVKPGVRAGSAWFWPKSRFHRPLRLRNHSSLEQVYAVFGPEVQHYRVVSMTRNPWDRAVSRFFYDMRRTDIRDWDLAAQKSAFLRHTRRYGPRTWLDSFWRRKRERALDSGRVLYFLDGRCCADYVIRFEFLEKDLKGLKDYLGLPEEPSVEGIRAKTGIRPVPRKHQHRWIDFYDDEARTLVAEWCQWEIEQFGYDFEGQREPSGPILTHLRPCSVSA